MKFGHEQLDVYQLSLKYVAWAYGIARNLNGLNRHARDQLLRASQSVPLNIAEGNGKGTGPDRRRFFEIARGSALECAAIQDTLVICEVISGAESEEGKRVLLRIVSMLTKLGKRDSQIHEDPVPFGDYDDDYDNDEDSGYRTVSPDGSAHSASGSI